jgi:hypothetical protein
MITTHGAEAISAVGTVDETVVYSNGDFSKVTLGGPDAQYGDIDRQEPVLNFLRDYYGKPGRVEK